MHKSYSLGETTAKVAGILYRDECGDIDGAESALVKFAASGSSGVSDDHLPGSGTQPKAGPTTTPVPTPTPEPAVATSDADPAQKDKEPDSSSRPWGQRAWNQTKRFGSGLYNWMFPPVAEEDDAEQSEKATKRERDDYDYYLDSIQGGGGGSNDPSFWDRHGNTVKVVGGAAAIFALLSHMRARAQQRRNMINKYRRISS